MQQNAKIVFTYGELWKEIMWWCKMDSLKSTCRCAQCSFVLLKTRRNRFVLSPIIIHTSILLFHTFFNSWKNHSVRNSEFRKTFIKYVAAMKRVFDALPSAFAMPNAKNENCVGNTRGHSTKYSKMCPLQRVWLAGWWTLGMSEFRLMAFVYCMLQCISPFYCFE